MGESKAVKDLSESDCVVMNGCPCLIVEILDPEDLGKDQYQFKGSDVIDDKVYTETYSPDDLLEEIEPEYEQVQIVSLDNHESVDKQASTVTLTDGRKISARSADHAAALWDEVYQMETDLRNSGDTTEKLDAVVVSAMGRSSIQ